MIANALPTTGHPFLDAVIILVALTASVAAIWRDKYVGSIRKELKEAKELYSEVSNELITTREQNAELYRRMHQKDIELAEMRGRTDFEPVRIMLKELIIGHATSATLIQQLADKLTISIKETSDLRASVDDLVRELRGTSEKITRIPVNERKA